MHKASLSLLLAVACAHSDPPTPSDTPPDATAAASHSASASIPTAVSLWEDLSLCDVRHQGLVIDAASDWADSHRGYFLGPFTDTQASQPGQSALAPVQNARVDYEFWSDREARDVRITVRAQAHAATRLSLDVDGFRLPEQRLPTAAPGLLTFGPVPGELARGRHSLSLRLGGRDKTQLGAKAYLDWLRVHLPDEGTSYVPPTKSNLLQDVALGDQPRRVVALRAPASIRCPLFPTRGTRLALDLGYWGTGEGIGQIKLLTADGRTILLAEQKVAAEEQRGTWTPLELSLDAFDHQLVAVEFDALQTSAGGRVAFAEPRLLRAPVAPATPKTTNVVLVLVSGLGRRLLPPWGDAASMPNLAEFVRTSTVFEGYRANSTIVPAVAATLLTGASVSQHRIMDLSARLPARLPVIADQVRALGGTSAFFTNVPFTFDAFGFGRAWSRFQAYSPRQDLPATEPLREGRIWLEQAAANPNSKLLVLHLSGAHPPWDVTLDEAKVLPPKDYTGVIDARRGAASLSDVRNGRVKQKALSAQDWIRLTELQRTALRKLDQSFGTLLKALDRDSRVHDSLVVFMGDVAMGDPPVTPLAAIGNLEEARLAAPLIVRFPATNEGRRITSTVGPETISRTLYESLGLHWPGEGSMPTLDELARDPSASPNASGSLALQGDRFAFTLGPWLLTGHFGEQPALCDLEIDPSCHENVFGREPFAAQWLWRLLLKVARQGGGQAVPREAAELDDDTRASLDAFGL